MSIFALQKIKPSILISSMILIAVFILPIFFAFPFVGKIPFASAEGEQEAATVERTALEKELAELEIQIDKYEKDISKTAEEKKTLQNQISILKNKISKLDLQIKQSNLVIKDLTGQIKDTESSISETMVKVADVQRQLGDILQVMYENDRKSLIEILLSEKEMSDFFDDIMALEVLNSKNQDMLEEIKKLKAYLESQKTSLDGEKTELETTVKIQTLQKEESLKNQKGKDKYLKLTEAQYQKSLSEKKEIEKKVAGIRSRIFELIGVPDAPTFGEALEMAKTVSASTGIRPAFLLAVLTQESNIGKNVGQCFLKDAKTGAGVVASSNKSISNVMSPKRDTAPFIEITKELGRDPFNTLVSCPMSYGYGGAMGPAQFIPSTWQSYKDRIKAATGKAADPWNIRDAFFAAGFYLSDYGAKKQTADAEWKAAMIYFSGGTNVKYSFYGDSVVSITKQYLSDIADLDTVK